MIKFGPLAAGTTLTPLYSALRLYGLTETAEVTVKEDYSV